MGSEQLGGVDLLSIFVPSIRRGGLRTGTRDSSSAPLPIARSPFPVPHVDEWGCLWRRKKGYSAGEVVKPALPSWDDWPSYQFPQPMPASHFVALRERMDAGGHSWYVMGSGGNLFERMQFLRGTENVYMDLGEDRSELHEVADRIVDLLIANIQNYLRAGVDGIGFGDDWGSQRSLLIRPEQWRSFFKPRYQRMFDVAKDGGAHVHFHTGGWTWDILDDFVEMGVDVLNPQHPLMGTKEVGRQLGGRVCIRSDIDRQYILPFGTPQQIVEHVQEVIEAFGRFSGGLILFGDIGIDTPLENIRAMYEAFREPLPAARQASGALPRALPWPDLARERPLARGASPRPSKRAGVPAPPKAEPQGFGAYPLRLERSVGAQGPPQRTPLLV